MNPPAGHPDHAPLVLVTAGGVVDGTGVAAAPGGLLVRRAPCRGTDGRVYPLTLLAAGDLGEVTRRPEAAEARRLDLPDRVLVPASVNAHTHLDLTHIGPRPYDPAGGFVGWVEIIRRERRAAPEEIRAAVLAGAALSLRAGVAAVGDIAGAPMGVPSLEPARALARTALLGTSFLEFFSIGRGRAAGLERIEAAAGHAPEFATHERVRLGLQPHATNTVEPASYARAEEIARSRGLGLSTHLAETPEEREFIARATGPQKALLEAIGAWEDRLADVFGRGVTPVAHLAPSLARARYLVAHVNDADDDAIATLARTGTNVAYCPRASAYFGAHTVLGPHRYRDMLAAGVCVALGTDSIVNLPPEALERGMSVLDEARFLRARDRTAATTLLHMATIAGARALGADTRSFGWATTSGPTPCAGIVATEVGEVTSRATGEELAALVLRIDSRDEFLSDSILYRNSGIHAR
jgi:cytosine/adenosine deaminase-related metal-dependent hydrolase